MEAFSTLLYLTDRSVINKMKQKTVDKQKIIQIALELFARKGFHTTTVEEIARKANIAKGSIYNYFHSKEQILFEVINFIFAEFDQLMPQKSPEEITDQDLIRMVKDSFDLVKQNPDKYSLYYQLFLQPDLMALLSKPSTEYLQQIIDYLVPFFQKKGVQNPRAHVIAFIANLDGLALHYIAIKYPDIDQILNQIIKNYILL